MDGSGRVDGGASEPTSGESRNASPPPPTLRANAGGDLIGSYRRRATDNSASTTTGRVAASELTSTGEPILARSFHGSGTRCVVVAGRRGFGISNPVPRTVTGSHDR